MSASRNQPDVTSAEPRRNDPRAKSRASIAEETRALERCIRDVVAISTWAAARIGDGVAPAIEGMAELLRGTLELEFVLLTAPQGADVIDADMLYTRNGREPAEAAARVAGALLPLCALDYRFESQSIVNPLGRGGAVTVAFTPVGNADRRLLMITAAQRLNYPTDMERLVLNVAASQAAAILEHQRAEVAIRQGGEERTAAEVAQRDGARHFDHFFHSAMSMWIEDFTGAKAALDALRSQGVNDVGDYLTAHPEFVEQAFKSARIVDVNDAAVELFQAADASALLRELERQGSPVLGSVAKAQLLAVAEGRPYVSAESYVHTMAGERRDLLARIAFPAPGGDYRRVLVSVVDITARRRAERRARLGGRKRHTFGCNRLRGDPSRDRGLGRLHACGFGRYRPR